MTMRKLGRLSSRPRGLNGVLTRATAARPDGVGAAAPARLPADERPPAPLAPPPPSADDAELDRLLAKVGEVGLPGLTEAERAALQRISAARRGRR